MIIDNDYYLNTYKGKSTQNFDKVNSIAQSVIESLTKRDEKKLNSSLFIDKIKSAICAQIEYLVINGEENAVNGQETGTMQSESIGSYSYTKANVKSSTTIKYINGIPIAPMVWVHFSNTDLLYRGVEKYV